MSYPAHHYESLLKKSTGFTEEQICAHIKLYEGYVAALEEIEKELKQIDRSHSAYAYGSFTELKRRYAVAFNGVALHELYFENIGVAGETDPSNELLRLFDEFWGSQTDWQNDLRATAQGGPGWVITAYNSKNHRMENLLVHEHHVGWPVRFEPLVVLDMWEHAFAIDFGMERDEYIDTFLEGLNWHTINGRLSHALKHSIKHSEQKAA